MGNCANKPLTSEGADPAPEEKPVETTGRELGLEQNSDEDMKPEAEVAAKPADAKPTSETIEPAKPADAKQTSDTIETAEPKKEETKPVEAAAKVEETKVELAPAKVEEKKLEASVSDKKVEVKKA